MGSGPTVASWSESRLDVFVRGTDNALWSQFWDGNNWSGWISLGGTITSTPAVCSWKLYRLDVLVKGYDNKLWHRAHDLENGWYGWDVASDANVF